MSIAYNTTYRKTNRPHLAGSLPRPNIAACTVRNVRIALQQNACSSNWYACACEAGMGFEEWGASSRRAGAKPNKLSEL